MLTPVSFGHRNEYKIDGFLPVSFGHRKKREEIKEHHQQKSTQQKKGKQQKRQMSLHHASCFVHSPETRNSQLQEDNEQMYKVFRL